MADRIRVTSLMTSPAAVKKSGTCGSIPLRLTSCHHCNAVSGWQDLAPRETEGLVGGSTVRRGVGTLAAPHLRHVNSLNDHQPRRGATARRGPAQRPPS